MSLDYNGNKNYLFVNVKINKFKANSKNVNFPCEFCLGSISLKGNVYDFSVDYDAIDKSNIINIHKYLMVKNNIE